MLIMIIVQKYGAQIETALKVVLGGCLVLVALTIAALLATAGPDTWRLVRTVPMDRYLPYLLNDLAVWGAVNLGGVLIIRRMRLGAVPQVFAYLLLFVTAGIQFLSPLLTVAAYGAALALGLFGLGGA